jgi:hypothetical protein
MRRTVTFLVSTLLVVVVTAAPASACGGLVGENGTIQLVRTSTLAAYHDGLEHYVTSFEFTGAGDEVGSIVPLPAVPTSVERGGDWTLQRLAREVAPKEQGARVFLSSSDEESADEAEVILETKIDALDITILKGGGDAVGEWALAHGFFLSPDAPEVLDFYAERSQVFMAARFDARRAADLGQTGGDGTPIHLTIPTDRPWVPLRILALGLEDSRVVDADVFLLTDGRPSLLAGVRGLTLDRSESASESLLQDLRSDVGMEWVPDSMWLSYLRVAVPAGELDFDLAASVRPGETPSADDAGLRRAEAVPVRPRDVGPALWPLAVGSGVAIAVFVVLRRRLNGHTQRASVG